MLQRQLTRLTEQQAALSINAPFAGEILTSDLDMKKLQGGYVHVGTPLALLADSDTLTARVWVPEKMLARIPQKEGSLQTTAELMLYAYAGRPFAGQINGPAATTRELNMGEFGEKLASATRWAAKS